MKLLITIFCVIFSFSARVSSQANYNDSLVPSYTLPKILVSQSGKAIKTKQSWETIRRQEILNLFKQHVYGEFLDQGIDVSFIVNQIDESALCGKAIRKQITMCFSKNQDTVKADVLIYLPIKAKTQAVPLFLGMNFLGNHTIHADRAIPLPKSYVPIKPEINVFNHEASELSRGVRAYRWPVERIIERGYGLATIYYGDIDPDFDDGFKNGIHKFLDLSENNNSNLTSSISAWAYALSKAMDYFETDSQINAKQITVMGHSRLGKAALWASAIDTRFAITISNNSGCGGAALSRRQFGETVKTINESFPHWFCKTFKTYNNNEAALPVDQHMLLSLMAPRALYIASAEQDKWADPKGEYLSLYHAGEVYKLYNLNCFMQDTLPQLNTSVLAGNLGYHIRSGIHEVTAFDWEAFLNFADSYYKNP